MPVGPISARLGRCYRGREGHGQAIVAGRRRLRQAGAGSDGGQGQHRLHHAARRTHEKGTVAAIVGGDGAGAHSKSTGERQSLPGCPRCSCCRSVASYRSPWRRSSSYQSASSVGCPSRSPWPSRSRAGCSNWSGPTTSRWCWCRSGRCSGPRRPICCRYSSDRRCRRRRWNRCLH